MANVRIIMWNIRFFSQSSIENQAKLQKIIGMVQPAGGPPACDIFIIIEPNKFTAPVNVGEVPNNGSSIKALETVFYALHHRNNAWRAVPPRTLTTSTNKEIHAIFYFSTNVTLIGPGQINVPNAANLGAAATPLLTGFGLAGGAFPAIPWGGAPADVGEVRHSPNAMAAAAANEVGFPAAGNRRPYVVRFQTVALAPRTFDIFSHHAAPESKHPQNAHGIRNFAAVHAIGAGRAHPTLITGDFNCCTLNPCPNSAGHHQNELDAQTHLTSDGTAAYPHDKAARDLLAAVATAADLAEATAAAQLFANAAVDGAVAGAQVALVGAAQALAPPIQSAENDANTIAAALGGGANAALLVLIAGAGAARLALAGAGAGNAWALALAARDAGIALADYMGANHLPPALVLHSAVAIRNTALTFDHVRAGNAGNAAATTVLAGNAAAAAHPHASAILAPVPHNNVIVAAAAAQGATAMTLNLGALAQTARDAVLALAALQYRTHILHSLSSLKTAAGSTPADYRNHAFDHILTLGFDNESNARVIDFIGTDPGFAAGSVASIGNSTWKAFFRRLHAGPGSIGISDHMPVAITVTLN